MLMFSIKFIALIRNTSYLIANLINFLYHTKNSKQHIKSKELNPHKSLTERKLKYKQCNNYANFVEFSNWADNTKS